MLQNPGPKSDLGVDLSLLFYFVSPSGPLVVRRQILTYNLGP